MNELNSKVEAEGKRKAKPGESDWCSCFHLLNVADCPTGSE